MHLSCLPMEDLEENAAIVHAFQSRADVVVQNSIAAGLGLTVAEAMWKARPVVASRIGGIQDQIIDGRSGILLDEPAELAPTAKRCEGRSRSPSAPVRSGERRGNECVTGSSPHAA